MTANAFIFAWNMNGIESVVPITQYEDWDKVNLLNMIAGKKVSTNPLDTIVRNILLRARVNSQRHYEVYAVECSIDLDEKFWWAQWDQDPQSTAELVRERGHKLFSDRATNKAKIT